MIKQKKPLTNKDYNDSLEKVNSMEDEIISYMSRNLSLAIWKWCDEHNIQYDVKSGQPINEIDCANINLECKHDYQDKEGKVWKQVWIISYSGQPSWRQIISKTNAIIGKRPDNVDKENNKNVTNSELQDKIQESKKS